MDRAKVVEQCFVDSGLGSDGCAALQQRAYDVWLYIGLTQGFRASADRFVPSDALLAKVEVAGSIPVVRSRQASPLLSRGAPISRRRPSYQRLAVDHRPAVRW